MPEVLAATTEAPVIDTPEITEPTTPEVSEPSSPEIETPESTEPVTADTKDDGRSFAGKLRDHYKELQASKDPAKIAIAKAVKDLFFQNKAVRDKFPGGVAEIEAMKASYEALGTPEQIESIQADAKILEDIDTKWQAGDPRFIDELADLNAESFKKLMPVGLNKFSQVDPEGYQRVMSGIIHDTLISARLDTQLVMLSDAVEAGNQEKAYRLIKGVADWLEGMKATSSKVPPSPATDPRNTEFEQKQAQLEEQRAEFFNTQLATEVNSWRDAQIKSALGKLTNGQKIDPERLEIFNDRVIRELVKMQPQDFKDKWGRLYAQGDKAALVKFVQGFEGSAITKAVSKVHALLFPGGAKKAPVTTPAAQPTTAKPAEAGWVKITARPKPEMIARGRNQTTDEMIFSGKAILRDGRKVMWDRA